MRSEPIKESRWSTNVSSQSCSKQQFLSKCPWTLPLAVQVLCLLQGPLFALLLAPPSVSGLLTLPLTCPSQVFSFEINVSVAIITFASKPKIVMSVLHESSRDVTEVIDCLDNINYKGMCVIKCK